MLVLRNISQSLTYLYTFLPQEGRLTVQAMCNTGHCILGAFKAFAISFKCRKREREPYNPVLKLYCIFLSV